MKGKIWSWHTVLTQPACIHITPLHTIGITPLHILHLHRAKHSTNTVLTQNIIILPSLHILHTCLKGPERVSYFGILNISCKHVSLITFFLIIHTDPSYTTQPAYHCHTSWLIIIVTYKLYLFIIEEPPIFSGIFCLLVFLEHLQYLIILVGVKRLSE